MTTDDIIARRVAVTPISSGAVVPCWRCGTLPNGEIGTRAEVMITLDDRVLCCLCASCRAATAENLATVAEIVRAGEASGG